MKFKQTLRNRLIIAFFLLTLTMCGAFAVSVFSIIHGLEHDLFYRHLEQDAEWLIKAAQGGSTPDLPPGIRLYKVKDDQPSGLPSYLKNIKGDRAEIILSNEAYHVVVRWLGDTRYYLVQDQTQFESLEQGIGATLLIGFVLALVGSVWLGSVTANKIIAPVIELSNRVEKADLTETHLQNLAQEYSNDEVGSLAAAFGRYAEKLQGFLEREQLFTGDVSHELRNPLMVITSSCELLLEKMEDEDPRREAIDPIYRASKEMQALVDTFLTLSREKVDSAIHFSHFQGNEIIEEEMKGAIKASKLNNVKTILHNNNSILVNGIPQLFRVVIKNLLRNAIHHTKTGTITLTIHPDSVHVEDTGQGIPEKFKNSIFERHYRVKSLDENQKGEGLGLAIVKRICDYHNWNIRLETVEPHGSRFILTPFPTSQP